jgi:hypothetical protein
MNYDNLVTNKNLPLILNITWFRMSLVKEIMNMKKLNVALAILVAAVMAGNAQTTVTSETVGYQTSTIAGKGAGSSFLSFVPNNLSKSAIYTGSASASGTMITFPDASLTGTLGPVSGVPTHYLLVKSGTGAGFVSDITAFTAGSVTTADNLSSSIPSGTTVSVVPHTKLTDILGTTTGLLVTGGSTVSAADNVYLVDATGALKIYYYKTSVGAGWKTSSGADATATIVYPGESIIVSRKQTAPVSVVTLGQVASEQTKAVFTQNMNSACSGAPVGLTLSSLYPTVSGGSTVSAADNVFLINPTTGALDIFYYKTGIGAGWKTAAGATADATRDISSGYLVKRRAATAAVLTQTKTW